MMTNGGLLSFKAHSCRLKKSAIFFTKKKNILAIFYAVVLNVEEAIKRIAVEIKLDADRLVSGFVRYIAYAFIDR